MKAWCSQTPFIRSIKAVPPMAGSPRDEKVAIKATSGRKRLNIPRCL